MSETITTSFHVDEEVYLGELSPGEIFEFMDQQFVFVDGSCSIGVHPHLKDTKGLSALAEYPTDFMAKNWEKIKVRRLWARGQFSPMEVERRKVS